MIRNPKLLKLLAVFFVIEITASTILPTVSWALTSGPTAPEATSFEPVDTTDMVNLISGDLAYNVPLLEVPGPSGGYPLSLSYHAGIQPNEDASWVGLGWTLNPGAINRSVNGYADDHANVVDTDWSFWEGGESRSFTIGVNVGYGQAASVMAGLTYSEDTYMGSGVGYYYGAGAKFKNGGGSKFGVNAMYGVSPYGDRYSSTGASVGIGIGSEKGLQGSASLGVSFDQDGKAMGTASVGASYGMSKTSSASLLDASISTSGNSSAGVGGFSGRAHSSNSGRISTSGYNYSGDIPTPWNFQIRLGKSYQRYWIDETTNVSTNGALYFPSTLPSSADLDKKAYDVYDLVDSNQPLSKTAADESLAGSFVDYDHYQVLGQGIGGTIRPYHFKSHLLRQNKKEGNDYRVKAYALGTNVKPSFRFVGDFSNRYKHDATTDVFEVQDNTEPLPLSFQFSANKTTGESGTDGFDEAKNVLPGSKHVEWFTNAEILDKSATGKAISNGFMDCVAMGFNNQPWNPNVKRDNNDQAGGFKVTNASGVVYHYALPAYSFDEYQYSGRIDEKGKHYFNTYKKKKKYAYTWLLTAVTGPDFVDTNENGLADSGDQGYWVAFDYGKWTPFYDWRNPAQGFNRDIDQNFETFSKGKKDLYYLNAIRTQTHTALFVKAGRYDGKGTVPEFEQAVLTGPNHTVRDVDEGGFEPKDNDASSGIEYPASTMRLDRIYLLQNDDFKDFPNLVDYVASSGEGDSYGYPYHQWDNVIDDLDLLSAGSVFNSRIPSKASKIIELKTDYSLCPQTVNSYISPPDAEVYDIAPSSEKKGKLTLKAVKVYGRGGISLIPETKFSYDDEIRFHGALVSRRIDIGSNRATTAWFITGLDLTQLNFAVGDIIRHTQNSRTYYGYVSTIDEVKDELRIVPVHSWEGMIKQPSVFFTKTKNPPYNKDFYDLWGHYKVDAGLVESEESENEKRRVTSVSAKQVDVWSLREITTSLGGKIRIQYESDVYKSALKSLSNIPIKSIEPFEGNKTKIYLYENLSEYGLQNGSQINLRLLTALRYDVIDPQTNTDHRFDCNGAKKTYMYNWITDDTWANYKIAIESVTGNSFVISHNFKSRYPAGGSNCLEEQAPYEEEHSTSQNFYTCIPLTHLAQSEPIFLGGEILFNGSFSPYGGGVRVAKVSLENFDLTRSTLYTYENGVTTYEPLGFALPLRKLPAAVMYGCLEEIEQEQFNLYRDQYMSDVYEKFGMLFANSRELPGPGVLYEQVTMREQIERSEGITAIQGKSVYQFEVFSPETIGIDDGGHTALVNAFKNQYNADGTPIVRQSNRTEPVLDLNVKKIETRNVRVVKDFSAVMGNLKRVILYDGLNNKISETINEYLHDNFSEASFLSKVESFKDQGTVMETFADGRIIVDPQEEGATGPKTYTLYGLVSQKVRYPSIQTGQTTINYKTGITSTTRNLAFDYYSGEVTKVLTSDAYGNSYISETFPAYRIEAYKNGMGLAISGGKNMLTQQALSQSFKVVPLDNTKPISNLNYKPVGLIGAAAQAWSASIPALGTVLQPGIWRKSANFSFIGSDDAVLQPDGLYPLVNDQLPSFSAWAHGASAPANWQKSGEIKLYNIYSNALEASDINDHYAATKFSSDHTKILATVADSRYNEFAYSGAEDALINGQYGGGVDIADGQEVPVAHTGKTALQLTGLGQKAFRYSFSTEPHRKYHASVWVNTAVGRLQYAVNGQLRAPSLPPSESRRAGDWYLLTIDIPSTTQSATLEIWCSTTGDACTFDDFRVHPYDAVMQSYVYNQWGDLSHTLDGNNLFIEYQYDAMGRLVRTFKETFDHEAVKTGEITYKHKNLQN